MPTNGASTAEGAWDVSGGKNPRAQQAYRAAAHEELIAN